MNNNIKFKVGENGLSQAKFDLIFVFDSFLIINAVCNFPFFSFSLSYHFLSCSVTLTTESSLCPEISLMMSSSNSLLWYLDIHLIGQS